MNEDRRREIELFRYALIRDAADPGLSKAERGRLVRALCEREHVGPDGRLVRVARGTLDRWIRDYRRGGFEALVPRPRVVAPRTPAEMLELAFRLKRERPERTAAQVREIMLAAGGPAPGLRTLQTHLAREGLNVRADGRTPGKVYGRFEASVRNELWTGDGLHGPTLAALRHRGRCCWRSSMTTPACGGLAVGHRRGRLRAGGRAPLWADRARGPDRVSGRPGLTFRVLPAAAGVRGARHPADSRQRPARRRRRARWNAFSGPAATNSWSSSTTSLTLDGLNRLFSAWVEVVYHRRVHSETSRAVGAVRRRRRAGAAHPGAVQRGVFVVQERTVTKTATVSLHGNTYEVDAALVGRKVRAAL